MAHHGGRAVIRAGLGIRPRILAFAAVSTLVLWIVFAVVVAFYATRMANATDTRDAGAFLDSSAAAVASEQERLVAVCGDWAPWDDAYYFIKHPSDAFIENNLGDETLANLGIDFMVFLDASGKVVFAKTIDPVTGRATVLPQELVRYLATQPALLHLSDPRAVVSGALSLRDGPYLIAALPIGKSNYSATPNGTLVTGLRLGDGVLSRIRKLTRRPISIYSSVSTTLPADVQAAKSSLTMTESRDVVLADDRTVVAYALVGGVEGGPPLVMRVETPRAAYVESRSTVTSVGIAMTVFGLVMLAVLAVALDRTVLRRLSKLSLAVADVARSTDPGTRIPVSGHDEISALATEVNRMLDELGRSSSEMSYLVEHDPLTQLFNRRHFENEVQRHIAEHRRHGSRGAILWFDLDHFKDINDSLGHAAGDELLRAFGQHLQSVTRSYCTVARLGGDEFGMLVPHAEEPEAVAAAVRLMEGVSARTFRVGDRELRTSVSIGVVIYPDHGDQTSELLARADIAMYDAKAKGGNQVVAYVRDDAWQTDMTVRLEAADRILSAMRDDRFLLYAQPIHGVADATSGVERFELLLRMRDESGDLVLPAHIIPTAERLGLIRDIDRWVARRAIRLLALAREEGRDVEFWINLSGAAFTDPALVDVIRDEFKRTRAPAVRLVIEITETTAIADIEAARTFIATLKKIGCRFAIDDFGSGAASFYYLKHLPVDFLKIDGSIVTGMSTNLSDMHFVRAIVEMCRGLKIETVAEYVESAQILEAITRTGVKFVQGYHVGMPEPLDVYLGSGFAESGHGWDRGGEDRGAPS